MCAHIYVCVCVKFQMLSNHDGDTAFTHWGKNFSMESSVQLYCLKYVIIHIYEINYMTHMNVVHVGE